MRASCEERERYQEESVKCVCVFRDGSCVMCCGWAVRVVVVVAVAVAVAVAVCVRVSFFFASQNALCVHSERSCACFQNAPVCAVKPPMSKAKELSV